MVDDGVYRWEEILGEPPTVPRLLIRLGDLDRVAADAMREFLGLEDFRLTLANVGAEKDYGEIYTTFKQSPLPADYVEAMYATKYARPFYTDAERAACAARWTGRTTG